MSKRLVVCALFTMMTLGLPTLRGLINASQGEGNQHQDHEWVFERRTGEAVRLRARQLLAKKSPIRRAYEDMVAGDLKPAFEKGATMLALDLKKPVAFVPQTITQGDYELTLLSFDSGNPSVWEGIIYARTPDNSATYTASIDISSTDPNQWDVAEAAYYPPEPGDGGDAGALPIIASANPRKNPFLPVSYVRAYGCPPWCGAPSPEAKQKLKNWVACSLGGCTTAAIGCAASGPGWGVCFAGWCGGSGVGCIAALF